jgi:PAS domain S-box-containing protein
MNQQPPSDQPISLGQIGADGAIAPSAAEEACQNSLLALSPILNAIADPVAIKDQAGTWCFLNDAYCQMVGYCQSDLVGQSEAAIFSAAEAERFLEAERHVLASGGSLEHEASLTDAYGQQHWVQCQTTLMMAGTDPMLVCTLRDITERLLAERTLWRKVERERLLSAIAQPMLHAFDPENLPHTTVNKVRRFLPFRRWPTKCSLPQATWLSTVAANWKWWLM